MRLSASRTAISTLPKRDCTISQRASTIQAAQSSIAEITSSADRVRRPGRWSAEDVLEVGQAVIAAEPHVVAEEGQQQRVGQRLGDDRQIDAGDRGCGTRSQPKTPASNAGTRSAISDREAEQLEAVPIPGQVLPAEKHHEIRQLALPYTPRAPISRIRYMPIA